MAALRAADRGRPCLGSARDNSTRGWHDVKPPAAGSAAGPYVVLSRSVRRTPHARTPYARTPYARTPYAQSRRRKGVT